MTEISRRALIVNMLPWDPRLKSKVVRSSLPAQSLGQVTDPSEMAQTEFPHDPTEIDDDGFDVGFDDKGLDVGKGVGSKELGSIVGLRVGFFVVGV